jgi:hypothetical protein
MFTIDPKLTEKDLKGKNIFKVLLSMNNHQVATPETSLEEARSYVFFIREGRNRISAYIGLHLLLTDRKLIYAHSANPFIEDKLPDVEDEARDFAEYMGAMLDDVDFASMSDLEQDTWIEDTGFFSTKTQSEAAPAPDQPAAVPEQPAPAPAPAPALQPAATPVQPAPAAEEISAPPEPPSVPVQPVPKVEPQVYHAESTEQPRMAPVQETLQQDAQAQNAQLAAKKRRQEMEQVEETTGMEALPKPTEKKISYSATSVVSRDREALARLLTSF